MGTDTDVLVQMQYRNADQSIDLSLTAARVGSLLEGVCTLRLALAL